MNCPQCGALTNNHGVYKGDNVITCLNCKTSFDFVTNEILYTGTSLEQGCRKREKINEIRSLKKS